MVAATASYEPNTVNGSDGGNDGSSGGGAHKFNLDCSNFDPASYVHNPYLTTSAFLLGSSMIIMNLLVVIFMSWSLRKAREQNIPKLLVLLLAVADGSYGMFDIITQAFRYWWGYCGTGGAPVCVTQAFMSNLIMVISSLFVVLMSAERFCALRLPFRYDLIFTRRNTFIILAAMLVYALILAAMPLMGINSYALGGFGCDFNWVDTTPGGLFYNYFRGFQGLILMPIIITLNTAVLREINRMASVAPAAPSGGQRSEKGGGGADDASVALQKRFAVLTLCASAAFVICNTPILVRLIQYQEGITDNAVPDYFIKRMYLSNSLINPCLSLFFYLSNIKWREVCKCIKIGA